MSRMEDKILPAASEDPIERRRHNRVDLRLKARFLTHDGVERPCLIINISAGGAFCRAVSPPPENEPVVLYVDQVGRFEGKVVRSGRHSFAVDYRGRRAKSNRTADAITLALHGEHSGHRKAAPRIKQDAPAFIVFESGETQPCAILDISLTGASIEIDPRPPLGARITLGKMAAKVVRRHEKGVGVVFSGPAKRMEDAIDQATGVIDVAEPGANIAGSFGRKGANA
ncbi:MAG TPA: PilZ domain-containing protein [Parvularculaceae bacterium]|nr:PilZ domain-containing protein [Parvularculaceae bacterium]